ncbi:MAG: prepilin-type N-terminal cleavage/methylation domain-containing protein [Candidatus Riflebacteria bacterium]|nr:prepilin-type N-terminal cleavage/methylation domain-containing protein [Candidatus Riflebacteria bacterium]
MSSRNIKTKSAFTLLEIMVASALFTIVGYGIYRTWSQINFNQSVTEARGQAKTDVEVIGRRLVRDISMARAKTITANSGADGIDMTITKKAENGAPPADIAISYSRDGNVFSRSEAGDTKPLTRYLKEFTWAREGTASGVIYITLSVECPARGYTDKTQTHTQDFMVTVREEAIGAGVTNSWRKSEDVLANW